MNIERHDFRARNHVGDAVRELLYAGEHYTDMIELGVLSAEHGLNAVHEAISLLNDIQDKNLDPVSVEVQSILESSLR